MTPSYIFHHFNEVITVDPTMNDSSNSNPLGILYDSALVIEDGKILWIGPSDALNPQNYPDAQWISGHAKILMPGLIDSHTHPIFAGNRADEFEKRLQGVTYLNIAQQGGGIQKTVQATRQATETELLNTAKGHLMSMLECGVTTVEAKSGYGLDWDSELKSLRVIRQLQKELPLSIIPTYMGAHDIPPEYRGRTDDYVNLLCEEHIPEVAREQLAVFCDVFCEKGYFTVPQSRKILETAHTEGLKLKIHAEEFCAFGGSVLAGQLKATSADHLLHITPEGIDAMKAGGTVATLLPGTAFFSRLPHYAPARQIIDAGIPVAIATDFNPGSCMCPNLQLIMQLSCLAMGMLPTEVIEAVTRNSAMALGCSHDRGTLTPGKRADLIIFNIPSYHDLFYHLGVNHLEQVFIEGQRVFLNPSRI